jgi:hypothetical protein
MRTFAATGVLIGAAFVFGAGFALAAPGTGVQGTAATAPVPSTEQILSVPAPTKRLFQPAQPGQAASAPVAEAAPASQRAGLAKPVKVYWFLSGR